MGKLADELIAHYNDLRRYLTRELRDPQYAADIAQSSFERVYLRTIADDLGVAGGSRLPIESPRALLFRVARNLCIDEARHRQVVSAWALQQQAAGLAWAAPSCEVIAAQRQVLARVVAAIEALPPLRREVFLLFRAYGHTRDEIAQRLKLSEAAVAKHLVRAAVDCSRAFAEMRGSLIEAQAVSARQAFAPRLAEELP
ncbi:MAG TPA: sigma-70 family RNA polymerase sigma factor [Ideonella sp.]|nr:sigma-70 family RNA polymerase sigma factor [Ideonella sp.]